MNRLRLFIATLLFVPVAFSQKQKSLEKQADRIIRPLVTTNNFSGTVLIAQQGKLLLSKAYGKMSREYNLNNSPDTKFFLASASMVFTSAAIMKLKEEGKLSLTDQVARFIPGYKHGKMITIGDLLSQRSGIPAIGSGGNVDYDSITKFAHSIEKLYSYFQEYDLLFTPGTKYNHGRSDYILLALIIEKITGKTFGQYLKESLFVPLSMQHTGHYSSEKEVVQNLAKGYSPTGLYDVESAYQIDWSSKTGHASIYSTTGDLQKFTQAALQSKFLTKESWDKIFTDYGDNVGYGWFISKHLNRERFQMNGRSPGYSSYVAIYPKEGLSVVVLSNNYVPMPPEIGKQLAALVLNEPFEQLNLTNKTAPAAFAKKFVGTYKFDKNFYRPDYELVISLENGHLVSDWGGLIPIDKGEKYFKEYILRKYWSSIRFIEDEKGEITQMMFDHHKGIKIK
ncbi:MAG TPA: serine hydrolase domain-containing protein [Flavisolibacter sp.]|nr:serine hydrolase domain-containing protein [Flavisolibacter sp.]